VTPPPEMLVTAPEGVILDRPTEPELTIRSPGDGLRYSVLVPVYNEEDNIAPLVERVTDVMDRTGESFEILFVDDGSRDNTPLALRRMVNQHAHVRAVRFSRNYGQEQAVQAAYKYARGQHFIQMDGDLQNPPEDIPKLLAKSAEGWDIVFGIRKNRQDPLFRRWASQTMRWFMQSMLDIELPEDISTFRVMRGETAKLLADLPERKKFLSALACWLGATYTTVDVSHAARAAGKTKYDFTKLLNHTFDLVVGFSSKPLRYIGIVGLLAALVGFAMALRAVIYKLVFATAVSGWASLLATVAFLGGVQLVALSLIGEYIARIYVQAQGRPFFVVAELLEHGKPEGRESLRLHPPLPVFPEES
jgi:glycosyltransferase involved in cell wall biosynthesis